MLNQCPEGEVGNLIETNWNRLHGTPEDLENFKMFVRCVNPMEVGKTMVNQNKAFVNSILTAIYAKNKLDYPPLGPMSESKQTFQAMKIVAILRAILYKQKTNDYNYQFGSINLDNMFESGATTANAWGMNAVRGMNRTISQPSKTMSSTGTSIKRMFGINRGGKRRHTKTVKQRR
jgi:hypothetical protein